MLTGPEKRKLVRECELRVFAKLRQIAELEAQVRVAWREERKLETALRRAVATKVIPDSKLCQCGHRRHKYHCLTSGCERGDWSTP